MKWNLELASKRALKYNNKTEFRKDDRGCYEFLKKHNYYDEAVKHMVGKKTLSEKECFDKARKCKTRKEFYTNYPKEYTFSKRKNILDKCYSHLPKKKIFNLEEIKKKVVNYSTRSDFQKNEPHDYDWIARNGLIEELFENLPPSITKWTIELAKKEAEKYKGLFLSDFKKNSQGAYTFLRKKKKIDEIRHLFKKVEDNVPTLKLMKKEALKFNNLKDFKKTSPKMYNRASYLRILPKITKHMNKPIFWNFNSAKKEAKKYKNMKKFQKGSSGACAWLYKNNLLEEATKHFKPLQRQYTNQDLYNISKKYTTLLDFRKFDEGAYQSATRRKLFHKITKHMTRSMSGYNPDKKGYVYYIRIEKDGRIVYKIGITNYALEKRFGKEQMKYIIPIKVWEFQNGKEAYKLEQEILNDYSYAKYTGDNILKSGNTEIFIEDVLMLDKQVA